MRMLKLISVSFGFALWLSLISSTAMAAQAPSLQLPKLRGTIKDPSGAAMPAVDVMVLQGPRVVKATRTDESGAFSFEIPAGEYQFAVTAPDFKTHTQPIRVAPDMPALSVTLSLEGVTSTVEVTTNTEQVSVDASLSLDGTTLNAQQIQDLPEDEEALLQYLQALAGGEGNAQLVVDGFEGGRIPPRDQIAQIIVEPNSFNATGTGPRITIVSRTPGPTRWAGNAGFQYRDASLNARTPNAANKPPSRRFVISSSYNGPLIKGKLGMTLNLSKQQTELANNSLRAVTTSGPVNAAFVSPSTYENIGVTHNWYFSPTHTLLHSITFNRSKSLNQGIGGFTLPERASDNNRHGWNFQISDNKTLSPRMTNTINFRMSLDNSRTLPRTIGVAINVLDAFNGGGAQNRSETRSSSYYFTDILRWTPSNKWNLQFAFNANRQSNYSFSENNYLGTFTFSSLEDYVAGRPITFTQTSGNPIAEIDHSDANVSFQATYRIKPTMSVSAGAQYTVQTHLKDYNNISPTAQLQVQVSRRSIISVGARMTHPTAGFPIFYYEQLIRGDGTTRQFNTVISNPSYPDPFAGGATGTTTGAGNSRQTRDENLESPYIINTQLGLNQTFPKNWRVNVTFNVNRQVHQIRSRNINAPFPGTPLDPSLTQDQIDQLRPLYPYVGNINRYESVGNGLSKTLNFLVQIPATSRILKTQLSGILQYGLNWAADDSGFQNPYNVRADWARNDQRHRIQSTLTVRPPRAGSFSFNVSANSGRAYSITTGRDDNFDHLINDRPSGVERNSRRGPGSYVVNLNYTTPPIRFRRREVAPETAAAPAPNASPQDTLIQSALNAGLPPAAIQQLLASLAAQPGIITTGTPSGPAQPQPSLRNPQVTFTVSVQNLFNNTRITGYGGVITSPLFGRPTGYMSGRTIQLSMNTRF